MKRWNKHATPLLVGKMVRKNLIAVWCPHCKKHHIHGWDPEENKDNVERRGAHCSQQVEEEFGRTYFIGLEPKVK